MKREKLRRAIEIDLELKNLESDLESLKEAAERAYPMNASLQFPEEDNDREMELLTGDDAAAVQKVWHDRVTKRIAALEAELETL